VRLKGVLKGLEGWTQYCSGCGWEELSPLSSLKRGLELIYPLKQEVDSHAGRSSPVNCIGYSSQKATLCVVGMLGTLFVRPAVCHRSTRYKCEVTEKAWECN
jgi:hypothetical protein